jgi:chromosome segregation ATPase
MNLTPYRERSSLNKIKAGSIMSIQKLEQLEAKIDLVLQEVHRLQQQNEKYLLKIKEVQGEKKSLQGELDDCRQQMTQITKLKATNKKMEDEKTLFQTKINDILNNLEKLDLG